MNAVTNAKEYVEYLIDAKCALDVQDDTGMTALMWAIGDPFVVSMLIESGCDLNLTDDSGTSPLTCAIQDDEQHCAQLLIEAGCRLNSMDMQQQSVLSHLANVLNV